MLVASIFVCNFFVLLIFGISTKVHLFFRKYIVCMNCCMNCCMDCLLTPESGAWEALPCLGKLHIAKNQFPQWIYAFGGYVFSDWAQALPLAVRIQCMHLVYMGWSGNRD